MITPEPPAGSEHYREGWRHGYEQAAIDRERSADAVRAVPDAGQARADHLAAGIRKFADDCKLLLDSGGLDNRVVRSIAQQERNLRALLAAAQAPESPTDSTPKAGRGGSGDTETTTDTLQAPDVASRVDTELMLLARAIEKMAGYDNDVQAPRVVERIGLIRALLGTDTTPDRLAWISEAGETAAVERQARYQETACARRPAAASGDPASRDLAYARSEVDKWLADRDPYCILPTRTEHIPALLARLDELEGTR